MSRIIDVIKAVANVLDVVSENKPFDSNGRTYDFDWNKDYDDSSTEEKIEFAHYLNSMGRFTHHFMCPECGGEMEYDGDDEYFLICEECGYDMPTEKYGFLDEDTWNAYNYIPSYEEVFGEPNPWSLDFDDDDY